MPFLKQYVLLQSYANNKLTLSSQGDRVIATARSRETSAVERLAHLKKAGAAVMELDVAASEDEISEKAKEAWSIYGQVDVLVNNAAYIDAGIFEETE